MLDSDIAAFLRKQERAMSSSRRRRSTGTSVTSTSISASTSTSTSLRVSLSAVFLRKQDVPVVLAVNKCESHVSGDLQAADFWGLGLGDPIPVSSKYSVVSSKY